MAERVWDRFLTEQDKAQLQIVKRKPVGFGTRPALLLIDNYRGVLGDQPEPLLDMVKTWPGGMGLAGWEGLARVKELLGVAREVGIPVIHITGLHEDLSGVPGWRESSHRMPPKQFKDEAEADRNRRKYDIPDEIEPLPGEVLLRKTSPSAFWGTPLAGHLNYLDIDTIIICGESTSGCVRASVVEGCTYRYRMIVAEEACYDRHEACHAINLFDMHEKYADVLPLAEIAEWLRNWKAQQAAGARELAGSGAGR
jgi:maleamate amidohydrolase